MRSLSTVLLMLAAIMVGLGGLSNARADQACSSSIDGSRSNETVQGQILAELPLELVHGVPAIWLNVNGQKNQLFLLDSGSQTTIIDGRTAIGLGMHLSAVKGFKITLHGLSDNAGMIPVDASPLHLKLGKKLHIDGDSLSIDLSAYSKALGIDIAGVIGYDIIRQYPTLIDYPNRCVTFYRSGSLHLTANALMISFDLEKENAIPVVNASTCIKDLGCWSARLMLDTGNEAWASVYGRFASEHHLKELGVWRPQESMTFTGQASGVHGISGWIETGDYQIDMQDVEVMNPDNKNQYAESPDISVGTGAFRQGQVLFDAENKKIYLIGIGKKLSIR